MYGMTLLYLNYTYFSDSVALFFTYFSLTGAVLCAYGAFQWMWISAALLGLGCDRILGGKKSYDYRWGATIFTLMLPQNYGYASIILGICAYALGSYYTTFTGSARQDDVWRGWVGILIVAMLIPRNALSNTWANLDVVHLCIGATIFASLWNKKYKEPFAYGVSVLSTPWMYAVTNHLLWVIITLGLLYWTHYILVHYRVREGVYMTKTIAYMILGGMASMGLLCASIGLWGLRLQGTGVVFSLSIYLIHCIVHFEGVYSVLRSKKFTQSTSFNVYILGTGILIWSLWSGWITNQRVFPHPLSMVRTLPTE